MTVNSSCKKTGTAVCPALEFFTISGLGSNCTDDAQKKWMCRHVTVYVDMNENSDNTKSESHANPNIWG